MRQVTETESKTIEAIKAGNDTSKSIGEALGIKMVTANNRIFQLVRKNLIEAIDRVQRTNIYRYIGGEYTIITGDEPIRIKPFPILVMEQVRAGNDTSRGIKDAIGSEWAVGRIVADLRRRGLLDYTNEEYPSGKKGLYKYRWTGVKYEEGRPHDGVPDANYAACDWIISMPGRPNTRAYKTPMWAM